jgi:hypothetical protein
MEVSFMPDSGLSGAVDMIDRNRSTGFVDQASHRKLLTDCNKKGLPLADPFT